MGRPSQFSPVSLVVWFFLLLSASVKAQEVTNISVLVNGDQLRVGWQALGQEWFALVSKDAYLGQQIPVIKVAVRTGDEELVGALENVYYRGTLTDGAGNALGGTTAYLDRSNNALPFTGFVATGGDLYLLEADGTSVTGIRMRLEQTANDVTGGDSGESGWKQGGKGGALMPEQQVPRGRTIDQFPSVDIYVDPSYIATVGETEYVARILQNLAVANTIYAQSGLKQMHLLAVVLPDGDIARSSSQGNILHGVERLRTYTVLAESADVSMVYSGDVFNQQSLWGWAEVGYGCELQQAVASGSKINTHTVGKAAFAVIDLPTLMQRGWIFAHEMSHTLGGGHIAGDPLSDGSFQSALALTDYVATCAARRRIYESCMFDPQTKALVDFYDCE